jgi:hypothetical protein
MRCITRAYLLQFLPVASTYYSSLGLCRILLLPKALPFPLVAALIRLGRKYDFCDLRNTVMERFTYENPTTVRGYIALLDGNGKYKTTRILNYPGVIYDMLTVARENNIQSCLPCAYYRAVQFHTLVSCFSW